jgi:sugar/nucleoside kinase (ribokinase family)
MPYNHEIQLAENLIIGRLQREYILPVQGPARVNQLGGNLPYTASAMAMWGGKAGLVSRVNPDYPLEWLKPLEIMGFDLRGIIQTDESFDARFFVAYSESYKVSYENPLTHFAERQLPFPEELFNYEPDTRRYCSKTDYLPYTFRVTDIPRAFLEANAAHICPIDFVSHKILPSVLRGGMIQTLSMRATDCYMDPAFWEEMRNLISELSMFMLSEKQALRLFQGRSVDLWEIACTLASYGPEYLIINSKDGAAWVYDRVENKRFIVPAWAGSMVDPTGGLNAFDGAFLYNYRKNYDIVHATVCANLSMGICMEGSGPDYLTETLTALRDARLYALSQQVIYL